MSEMKLKANHCKVLYRLCVAHANETEKQYGIVNTIFVHTEGIFKAIYYVNYSQFQYAKDTVAHNIDLLKLGEPMEIFRLEPTETKAQII